MAKEIIRKTIRQLFAKYNTYVLNLLACITDCRNRFMMSDWNNNGLHLKNVQKYSSIKLGIFPEYANYIEKLTGVKFKHTYCVTEPDGTKHIYMKPTTQCSLVELLSNVENISEKDMATLKDLLRKYIGNYLRISMIAEKYDGKESEMHEYIDTGIKFTKFFNHCVRITKSGGVDKVDLKTIKTIKQFIKHIQDDFGIELHYSLADLKNLSYGRLNNDVFRAVERQIDSSVYAYVNVQERTRTITLGGRQR